MTKSILSPHQKELLNLFSTNKNLLNSFYLTGGTALCEFYIPYRLSEDLDFFSEKEFEIEPLFIYLKSLKNKINYKKLDFNTSFNRNIFQLIFSKENLKLEFIYFPFPRISKEKTFGKLEIDSVVDIATNKLFTIYQNPRSRDFMDLYMIHKKYKFDLKDLIKKAKAKFDWHVDPIKLGSQFLLAKKVKDYPILIEDVAEKSWQTYFEKEARRLENEIFSK